MTSIVQERKKQWLLSVILPVLTIFAFLFSLEVGRYQVSLHHLPSMLLAPVFGWPETWTAQDGVMLLQIRLPRVLCALVLGGVLSVSGCA